MMSKNNKRGKKLRIKQVEDDEMQLTEEANSSRASWGAPPAPSCDGAQMEEEEEPVNLMTTMKVLRGVGNKVKEFQKDMDLDKTNARLNEVETRVAGHEDKLQSTDKLLTEMITTQEKLQLKLTPMEAYPRRETLRLYGVPEGEESGSQSMIQFVEKLLRENLSIPSSTALQIQRAHRALAPPPYQTTPSPDRSW